MLDNKNKLNYYLKITLSYFLSVGLSPILALKSPCVLVLYLIFNPPSQPNLLLSITTKMPILIFMKQPTK